MNELEDVQVVRTTAPPSVVSIDGREVLVGTDPSYVKVEGHANLIKERRSGAILNTDRRALQAYRARRQNARAQQQLAQRVENLERKLDLILAALQTRDSTP